MGPIRPRTRDTSVYSDITKTANESQGCGESCAYAFARNRTLRILMTQGKVWAQIEGVQLREGTRERERKKVIREEE